eukprot:COSAG03_NODE_5575_length_1216_cov_14.324715_1_plen_148_part_00
MEALLLPTVMPAAQPLLLVPPREVQAVLHELALLRWTAQKWQRGGRYGVQVRRAQREAQRDSGGAATETQDDRAAPRGIPITAAAAAALAAYTETEMGTGADTEHARLPPHLRELLGSGRARLHYEEVEAGALEQERSRQQRRVRSE